MTHDVPPCPHCGRLPSPSGCCSSYDIRGLAGVSSATATQVRSCPLLIFCSDKCCQEFWEKAAEELKAKRLAGR